MDSALDAQSAIESIAAITERSIRLSHSLYDISSGLVDSPVTPAVNTIAQEFAELSSLAQQLGELLQNGEHMKELLEDAGKALSRLDMLVKYFEDTITDFSKQHVPRRFRDLFKDSNISDLTWHCRSVKDPLRLQISHLRIAYEQQRLKRAKKKRHIQDLTALTRECEFAESWVEASRQVIKALLAAERRVHKSPMDEVLRSRYREGSWGSTALWLYNLVFARALKALPASQRLNARGRVKTVRTTDGNAAASDSEHSDEITDHIPADLERELYVTAGVRRDVVNELLQRWTGLDYRQVRQITDSMRRKDNTRVQDSVTCIIRWYMENEKSASDRENAPRTRQNSRGRSEKREQDATRGRRVASDGKEDKPQHTAERGTRSTLAAEGALPKVPSPPTSPKITPSQKQNADNGDREVIETLDEPYYIPVRGRSATPKVPSTSRALSPETVKLPSRNVDLPTLDERRKRDAPTILKRGDTITTQGDAPVTIKFVDPPDRHNTSKRPVAPKDRTADGNSRSSQNAKRASNQHAPSKADIDTHHPQRLKKDEHYSSDGFASESKHRPRSMPMHSGIRHRNSMPPRVPGDDHRVSNSYPQHTPPNPRRPFTDPPMPQAPGMQASSMYNTSGIGGLYVPSPEYGFHVQHPPGPGLGGPYPLPAPPVRPNGYSSTYPEQISSNDDGRIAVLQHRLDEFDKGEKARRDAEEAKKEEGRRKAQEEEQRLTAQRHETEELRTRLLELQESERRNAEKWEEEKRTIERSLKEHKLTEEQAHKHAEDNEMQSMHRKEEMDRLHTIIANLQDSERRKTQEWEKERDRLTQAAEEELRRKVQASEEERNRLTQAAEEELRRKVQASEEERQKAIDGVVRDYEKKLEAEQENARKANQRAEHYVGLYNTTIGARHEDPATTSRSTTAPEGPFDPFLYMDKNRHSSSGSVEDESTTDSNHSISWIEQNPWADRSPWQRAIPQDRTRRYTASAVSNSSDGASNVIVFPPRAGANEFGPNQLGNYLSSSGFKAMFEVREPNAQDARGRFEKIGSGGNVLRGTLFWQPPASTAEAELYKSLRSSGWRPTYVRTTVSGQTWFFGPQPVHVQFFSDMYKPQVRPFDISRASHGAEKESLVISKDLVEIDELDFLGHIYKEQDGKVFLDPTLTAEDIDHIVARSFLAREGRYRKKFRNTHLRFSPPKQDIVEVASEAGESESSQSSSLTKDRRLSLWPFWGPWSGQQVR